MQSKIIKRSISVGAVALLGLVFTPSQADAFTFESTIGGDNRGEVDLNMYAKIKVTQEGYSANQAKWSVSLLDEGDVVDEGNVGFKAFGFNIRDRIAKSVSFSELTPSDDWSLIGTGDGDQALEGSGGLTFDYLFKASKGKARSRNLEFLITYDDGDANTLDTLLSTDFSAAAASFGDAGSGQAAGHVIGFVNADASSGVVVGEVPTPALLPGLVGICTAALRKRKKVDELEETA